MNFDRRIAIGTLAVAGTTALGGLVGWFASDFYSRGVADERMNQLQVQVARLPEVENQRQREKDRADRLDVEVISLRQQVDKLNEEYKTETSRLRNELHSTQQELSAADAKASTLKKCEYLGQLTRESKAAVDNDGSILVMGNGSFSRQANERKRHLLEQYEKSRADLLACLTG